MTRATVVTGASEGIGCAAAEQLSMDGWSVIGVARQAPPEFPETFLEADLGDAAATQSVIGR